VSRVGVFRAFTSGFQFSNSPNPLVEAAARGGGDWLLLPDPA